MALRCLNFVKNISRNKSIISFVRHNSFNITEKERVNACKTFKTENNVTYLEDPDTFGTISKITIVKDEIIEDEGDLQEENFQSSRPLKSQQLTIKQYSDIIKQYVKNKRIKEALDVLEVRMLKEDRVKPENYIYNILIGACAEVGYTKRAFKLYNDMKKRALKPTGDTYTCLFEACMNSPWKENGLKHARNLRNLMIEKGVEPNLTNYNVMIKAFGRCGDLPMAFKIVDEMISKKIKIRVHTFNHLLHACISDKESGLRHALIVWRKMLTLREKPNIYSFNLILKCVKECNLGCKEDIQELINIIQATILQANNKFNKPLQIDSSKDSQDEIKLLSPSSVTIDNDIKLENTYDHSANQLLPIPLNEEQDNTSHTIENSITLRFVTQKTTSKTNLGVPNLLSQTLQLEQVCGLQEVNTVQDKFAIVGGQDDFLEQMALYSVKPDIKIFTQMLEVIDNNIEAENKVLCTIKAMKLKPDIEFYNMLIKKRCLRLDYDNAFAVKEMIEKESKRRMRLPNKKRRLKVNIMTYGILAMACKTKEDGEKLLNEMKEKQLKVNIQILGTLLRHGTANSKFGYVLYIMDIVKQENLKPNDIFMKHLELFNEKCEAIVKKYKQKQINSVFVVAYDGFSQSYSKWLTEVNIEDTLKIEDPWKQFQEPHPETVQREIFKIDEPKRFYKRNRKFVPFTVKVN
ncbi:pentatricopeptide repeat-containing protein 1, mitochondrial [Pieris rapae]|uniref:pentatricopeptide repeat-containing protein 1, mitochondrial n=1 Tax=Pieris rapae TaxID=64459 RepID=UPI001E28010E|nr:pentatricopeptide repeat-containing protein 1, mitochondrial [Pieris rapae]